MSVKKKVSMGNAGQCSVMWVLKMIVIFLRVSSIDMTFCYQCHCNEPQVSGCPSFDILAAYGEGLHLGIIIVKETVDPNQVWAARMSPGHMCDFWALESLLSVEGHRKGCCVSSVSHTDYLNLAMDASRGIFLASQEEISSLTVKSYLFSIVSPEL